MFKILYIYDNIKTQKRTIINKVLYNMNQISNNSIVDDSVYVAVKNTSSPTINNGLKICKYDLLVIGDLTNGTIHKFRSRLFPHGRVVLIVLFLSTIN